MAPQAMKAKQVRASLGKFAAALMKKPAAAARADDGDEVEEVMEEATVEPQLMKKPAAPGKKATILKRPAAVAAEEEEVDEDAPVTKKGRVLQKPAAAGKAAPEKDEDEQESESAVASRKKELSSMLAADLKDLVLSKGLEASNKGANVEAMLAFEANERQAAAKKREQFQEVVNKHREDLKAKTIPELKQLCEQKGVKAGGSKDDRVERLLELAKTVGDIDRTLAAMVRDARKEELVAMDKSSLQALCSKVGVDPLNKEVMIDRILGRETEN